MFSAWGPITATREIQTRLYSALLRVPAHSGPHLRPPPVESLLLVTERLNETEPSLSWSAPAGLFSFSTKEQTPGDEAASVCSPRTCPWSARVDRGVLVEEDRVQTSRDAKGAETLELCRTGVKFGCSC